MRTAAEIEACIQHGTLAVILHFEGAEPIDTGLELLPVYYEQGLRSLRPGVEPPQRFRTWRALPLPTQP